jgi:hypothetical protein
MSGDEKGRSVPASQPEDSGQPAIPVVDYTTNGVTLISIAIK